MIMNKQEAGRLGGRPRALTLEDIRQHQALEKENEKGGKDTLQDILASNNLHKLRSLYLCRRSTGNKNKTKVGTVFPH